MFLTLLASASTAQTPLGALLPAAIPVWDQYIQFLTWALDSLATVFHSGGLAIIAFTIVIKTIILPLTVTSIRSSKAMQDLQPKIKELQKKHGKDRQRLSQETMALYQQHKVNPMAGCLPMLIQLPIFFGLYNAILHLSQSGAGYWNQAFLWVPNLAHPDPWHVLPVLAACFQFVQTKMMRPANQGKISDPQQSMMNSMMNIMPLTVILFGWGFAAGPVIYWVTQSMYSVAQQWFITGWGSLHDWVPNLPELAEHKRLGYRPPRPVEDLVVVSGEGGQAVRAKGISGWFQAQMERAQAQAAMGGSSAAPAAEAAEPIEAEVRPVNNGGRANGSRRSANAKTKGGGGGNAGAATNGAVVIEAGSNGASNGAGNGKAVIVPRKAKPAAADGQAGRG